MNKHIGTPGERLVLTLTVRSISVRSTDFGPIADHTLVTPEGDVLFWSASTHAVWLQEGGSYTVKATIKSNEIDDSGGKVTHLLRVVAHYEPPRTPRVTIGLARRGGHRR